MRCSFLIALTSSSRAMSRSSAAARAASASIDAASCEAAGTPIHAATPIAARAPRAIAPCVVRIALSYSVATYLPTGFGKLNGGTYVLGHVLYSTLGGRSGGSVPEMYFAPVGSGFVCQPPSYGTYRA